MEKLFETVLGMSVTGAGVILLVLMVRLALRRAPKRFSYLLWAVVLFRLLCPVSLESAFSLLPSAGIVSTAGYGGQEAQVVQVQTGLPNLDRQVNDFFLRHPYQGIPDRPEYPEAVPSPVVPQAGDASDWRTIPAALWLAGTALLLGWSALSLLQLRRRLAEAIPLEGEPNVRIADGIPSPFVLGLLRPRIYLPSGLPEGERDYILLHERTHIRRFDHILRALAWLAVSVHWFNPLVWLAFRLAGKDMEMSCDEAVLRKMGRDVRADYSASLLRLSVGGRLPAGPLAFGDSDPKSRIKNVLNYKKPALWVMAAAVTVVALTCAALATNRADTIKADAVRSVTAFNASSYTATDKGTIVYTPEDRAKDLQNPSDLHTLSEVEQSKLLQLINSYNKTVYKWNDFTLNGSEHHFFRIDCADGSFYLVDYWYWNGYSFNPLHHGEDDYTTLVSRFDAQGSIGITWQMEYSFDLEIRELRHEIMQDSAAPPAEVWLDYLSDPSSMPWDEYRDIQLPEFPGQTFRWRPASVAEYTIDVDLITEGRFITGMPVENVILCDLNGDGKREFCATVSYGSGLIDSHIEVYDYANRHKYTLWDRGMYDYALSLEDGQLMVTKSEYRGETLASGRLILTEDGRLAVEGQEVDSTTALPIYPGYELSGEGSVRVTKLGETHVEWNLYSYVQPFLYFAGDPFFFCPRLAGRLVEGSAMWVDSKETFPTVVEVSLAVNDDRVESGTIYGFSISFTVDTESGTVTQRSFRSWVEGETLELKNHEMVAAARTFAKLLREAEVFYYDAYYRANPVQAPELDLTSASYALDDLWTYVDVTGLDCEYARWYARKLNTSSEIPENALGYLDISQPRFLGLSEDYYYATAVYSPQEDQDHIWIQLGPRAHGGTGEVHCVVDLTTGQQSPIYGEPYAELDPQALLSAARAMAQLIIQASDYHAVAAVPEEGPLPFDKPMKLWFGSGAGAWCTILTLHPDGTFEGDFHDADMTILYVCQFHGRFTDITQVSDTSWSMTLEELVLDTKYPVGREWDADGYHYISSEPYGFDGKDGKALKPGAKFTFYTPEATGYAPGDDLYGMTDEDNAPLREFWSWWPAKHGWGPNGDVLGCYALHNVTSGRGFFDLHAWGLL